MKTAVIATLTILANNAFSQPAWHECFPRVQMSSRDVQDTFLPPGNRALQHISSPTVLLPDFRSWFPAPNLAVQTVPNPRILDAIVPDFQVNENTGRCNHYHPAIAATSEIFVAVWIDERNGNFDIYAQRFTSDGNPIGANFQVNDDEGSAVQDLPSVAIAADGAFIVAWKDNRNSDWDIYAQRFDPNGNPIGTNFRVNNDEGNANQGSPSLATFANGSFVIAWADQRSGNFDIYAQRFDPSGNPIGNNLRINDDGGTAYQSWPSLAATPDGAFVVAWSDQRNGNSDIYAQRFDPSGNPIGANFRVNDDEGTAYQSWPSLASTPNGAFVATWPDQRGGNFDIYSQRFDSNGTPIGTNFRVNDDKGAANQGAPAVAALPDGAFIVVWADDRNGYSDVYAQRFDAYGNAIGANFVVTANRQRAQKEPDVALYNGRIYNIWITNHVGTTGWDIWANVLEWDNPSPTRVLSSRPNVPAHFTLQPAYPNPFNSCTTVAFSLPTPASVNLSVYNAHGRRVRILFNGSLNAGVHRITWDATDDHGSKVTSGLYFCRATVDGQQLGVAKLLYVR